MLQKLRLILRSVDDLAVVGADQDSDGNFQIYGAPCISGAYDKSEIVVPAAAEYSVGGRRCNLAAGLAGTSYGLSVVVI